MSDLISRQAAIDALHQWFADGFEEDRWWNSTHVLAALEGLPSTESERKKGKWIVTSEFEDCRYAKCNQCKVTQIFYYGKPLTNFCPNCGAELRGEQNGQ